jgi:hypothetical protein
VAVGGLIPAAEAPRVALTAHLGALLLGERLRVAAELDRVHLLDGLHVFEL